MTASRMLQEFVLVAKSNDFVILDMETTGLHNSECLQIAVINQDGDALVNTLVKPKEEIPWDAIAIHGIDAVVVAAAPAWDEIWPDVHAAIVGRNVIVYNVGFDRAVLYSSTKHAGLRPTKWLENSDWYCAMEAFAEIFGDWNNYHGSFRWQKLATAVAYFDGHDVTDYHGALADCRHTLFVTQHIAKHTYQD